MLKVYIVHGVRTLNPFGIHWCLVALYGDCGSRPKMVIRSITELNRPESCYDLSTRLCLDIPNNWPSTSLVGKIASCCFLYIFIYTYVYIYSELLFHEQPIKCNPDAIIIPIPRAYWGPYIIIWLHSTPQFIFMLWLCFVGNLWFRKGAARIHLVTGSCIISFDIGFFVQQWQFYVMIFYDF